MVRCHDDEPLPDLFICVILACLLFVTGFVLALKKIDADRDIARSPKRMADRLEQSEPAQAEKCSPGY